MTDTNLPPLSDESRVFLSWANDTPGPNEAVKRRVLGRVSTLAAGAAVSLVPDVAEAVVSAPSSGVGLGASVVKLWVGGAFVAGSVFGGGAMHVLPPMFASSTVPVMELRPEPASPSKISSMRMVRARRPADAPLPTTREAPARVSDPVDRAFETERQLIAEARTALIRGHFESASRALAQHARDFKDGQLEEERRMLEVRRAFQAGDRELAREKLRAFHKRFPNSVFRSALDQTFNTSR